MSLEEIKALYGRCLSGTATTEEQALFESYKDQFDLTDIPWTVDMGNREEVKNNLLENLEQKLKRHQPAPVRKLYWSAAAAAAIVIGFGIAWFTWKKDTLPSRIQQITRVSKKAVIKPGGNKAILILGDAKSIALDGSEIGQIATQNNTAIVKGRQHLLKYEAGTSNQQTAPPQFNTLVTPRGGQYQLELADGTKVWLNADSRLRFPVSFSGTERVVELIGEAYFEVAKNQKMPFKVKTGLKTVTVLGTHFNVSAYNNDVYRTTLLEGSVRVSAPNGASALLRPSEQGYLDAGSRFNKVKADTAAIIAWKKGIFLFRNENVKNIMKQLSRWYDLDVVYQGNFDNVRLGGTVSRYTDINKLLNTMQLTGSVRFRIEGRRVIVMK